MGPNFRGTCLPVAVGAATPGPAAPCWRARVLLEFQRTMRRSGHETTFYGAIPIVEKVLRLMVPSPRPEAE
jgi:hypothetical protein